VSLFPSCLIFPWVVPGSSFLFSSFPSFCCIFARWISHNCAVIIKGRFARIVSALWRYFFFFSCGLAGSMAVRWTMSGQCHAYCFYTGEARIAFLFVYQHEY
jgi:hypothetical protein